MREKAWTSDLCFVWVSVRGPRGYLGHYRRGGSGWEAGGMVSNWSRWSRWWVFGKAVALPLRIPCHPAFAVSFRVECCTHTCLCLTRNEQPVPLPPRPSSTPPSRIVGPLASTSLSVPLHPTPLTALSTLRPGHSDRQAYSSCYVTPLRFP